MANIIKCKNCGVEIKIDEALRSQIQAEVLKNLEKQHQEELSSQRKNFEEEKAQIRKAVKEELTKDQSVETEDMQKQIKEQNEKIDQYRKNELEFRERNRQLEQREKDLELETQRRLDTKIKKIEEDAFKRVEETHQHKDKEKDQIIENLKKSLADLQRQANQNSQQLQGEVEELSLEEKLRNAFQNDDIEPIAKGVKGGDIRQRVKSPKGFECGTILWESKYTKNWSQEWISKLKADLRAEKANIAAIVSVELPKDMIHPIEFREGVWVCKQELVIPLATLLRKSLLDVGYQKAITASRGDCAENLYNYVTNHEFIQQVEIMLETYNEMYTQVQKERTVFEKIWAQRESQARRIFSATANIIGNMQGKLGQNAMPRIKGLELLEEST